MQVAHVDIAAVSDHLAELVERIQRVLVIQLIALILIGCGMIVSTWIIAGWSLIVVAPLALLIVAPVVVNIIDIRQLTLVAAIPAQLRDAGETTRQSVIGAIDEYSVQKEIATGRIEMMRGLFMVTRKLSPLANQPGELAEILGPMKIMAHPAIYLATIATQILSPLVLAIMLIVMGVALF